MDFATGKYLHYVPYIVILHTCEVCSVVPVMAEEVGHASSSITNLSSVTKSVTHYHSFNCTNLPNLCHGKTNPL